MFLPHYYDDNQPDSWVYLPAASAAVISVGMALKLSSGALVKASGTDKPEYIAMGASASGETDKIPVIRVSDDTEYETELSEASANIAIGVSYTIDTTGNMITATSTNGVAKVCAFDGKAAGDKVRVRF